MALNFKEANRLIDSGKALPAINEFLQFAATMNVALRTGQVEEMPGMNATYVAAIALQRLIDTKDGRRLLGIRKGNKVYDVKEYPLNSPRLAIGRRLVCGEITEPGALDLLRAKFAKTDIFPDPKTLKQILRDMFRGNVTVCAAALIFSYGLPAGAASRKNCSGS
ncbi:MAG: hypothetical protein IPJ52_05860 [Rhodocyclaceae bacterium]|nr:hypothetical protein [Rhodocyclaceae bacterium]